jgi:hypothetical protein
VAQRVTGLMFPWERYQMDNQGKPLRTWEKAYWGIFVVAISYFLFSKAGDYWKDAEPDPAVEDRKKATRVRVGGLVVRGRASFVGETSWTDEDPFEGMSPADIDSFVQKEVAPVLAAEGGPQQTVPVLLSVGGQPGLPLKGAEVNIEHLRGAGEPDPYEGLSPREIDEKEAARNKK